MKKTIITFAIMLAAVFATAQDTVVETRPMGNYLYNTWNNYKCGDFVRCEPFMDGSVQLYPDTNGMVFFNNDMLPIYGVAMGVFVEYGDTVWAYGPLGRMALSVADSCIDDSYINFVIMETTTNAIPANGWSANENATTVSDSAHLHLKYTPVSYYLDRDLYFYHAFHPFGIDTNDGTKCPVIPVYEVYFSEPANVSGMFYLACHNHSHIYEDGYHNSVHPQIRCEGWYNGETIDDEENDMPYLFYYEGEYYVDSAGWIYPYGWSYVRVTSWPWLFPILTPNPDTNNYVPDDSTQSAIRIEAWERYATVQPNPATDKATVLSSVGLKEVEVYDMAGNRVLVQGASGLSAKLDVGTLPRGTYIVRIHTPLGVTSRKLLLQ